MNRQLTLLFALCTSLFLPAASFKTSRTSSGCLASEARIKLESDNETIGYVYYTQLPCKIYVVHSFFVFDQFRKQGNGKKLLEYVVKTLQAAGARLVFVQPGPFELNHQQYANLPAGKERTLAIQRLVKLYKLNGFRMAPPLISWGARLAYKIAGIQEDPQYLMLRS